MVVGEGVNGLEKDKWQFYSISIQEDLKTFKHSIFPNKKGQFIKINELLL